jgi:hypothetical protein
MKPSEIRTGARSNDQIPVLQLVFFVINALRGESLSHASASEARSDDCTASTRNIH